MSTNDPDELRREIDQTRSNLSYDVNALADEAAPRNIARRQVRRVHSSAMSLRERLFGSDDDYETEYAQVYDPDYYRAGAPGGWQAGYGPGPTDYQGDATYQTGGGGNTEGGTLHHAREGVGDVAHQAREGAGDMAHHVRDTAADAPRQIRRKTQGAPLTLGLIAFGVGGLVAAMLPPSAKEREMASTVKQQATPLVDEAKSVAKESADHVKPAAQEAVESVKDEARSGAHEVRQEAKEGAGNVRDRASEAKDDVKNQ